MEQDERAIDSRTGTSRIPELKVELIKHGRLEESLSQVNSISRLKG
jgi:hypothetical protein